MLPDTNCTTTWSQYIICRRFIVNSKQLWSNLCIFVAWKQLKDWPKVMIDDYLKDKKYEAKRKLNIEEENAQATNVRKRKKMNIKNFSKKTIAKLFPPIRPKEQIQPKTSKAQERDYGYIDYNYRRPHTKPLHDSMLGLNYKTVIPTKQDLVGECILCTSVFSATDAQDMMRHYRSKHFKGHVIMNDITIMRCKCNEVRPRGADGSYRNSHYHCTLCFHPSDHKRGLAKHYITKHGYMHDQIKHLLPTAKQPAAKSASQWTDNDSCYILTQGNMRPWTVSKNRFIMVFYHVPYYNVGRWQEVMTEIFYCWIHTS